MKTSVELFYSLISASVHPEFGFYSNGKVWFKGEIELDYDGYPNPWTALVTVSVSDDWMTFPPEVNCHNRWLKREIDWHVPKGDALCWVYPPQWSDRLHELFGIRGKSAAQELATEWLLRNIRHLLTCHIIANEYGIQKWPRSWPQYSHNGTAEKEYIKDEHERKSRIKQQDGAILIG